MMGIAGANKEDISQWSFLGNSSLLKNKHPLALHGGTSSSDRTERASAANSLCRWQEGRTMRMREIEIESFLRIDPF